MTPASKLLDGPISISQGPDKPAWTPKNYSGDFLGNITMRMGLERSRNATTVYLASLLGIERIQEIGKRFGVYDELPSHYATVLGSQETTLLKLANAYSILVNGGKRVEPQLIERIDNRYGKIIYRRDSRDCNNCAFRDDIPAEVQKAPPELEDNREIVVDAASAFQVTHMLQGVVERGTAKRAKVLGIPLGGKTGTTNESRDAWFVGFAPDLVVGLYVGFDKPRPLGPKETGSSVALPGFVDFMKTALNKDEARPFTMPEGIRLYKIDRWTGRPPYVGSSSKNIIYEAFKYYENPNNKTEYGTLAPPTLGADTFQSDAPIVQPPRIAPTNDGRWDYATGNRRKSPRSAKNNPNRGWVIPGQNEANRPKAPVYNETPNYVERAQQLQRQREARGGYVDNGVVGSGRYNRPTAPNASREAQSGGTIYDRRQRQPAPAYGTGGLY